MAASNINNDNNNAQDSLLGNDEKKRQLFWSILWLIFSLAVALPLCSMLAPIWLMLQLVEAFLPVCTLLMKSSYWIYHAREQRQKSLTTTLISRFALVACLSLSWSRTVRDVNVFLEK